ncbi:MAG: hypothetical protein ABIP75_17545 [Pyrinomonadaceae bacterium]
MNKGVVYFTLFVKLDPKFGNGLLVARLLAANGLASCHIPGAQEAEKDGRH